MLENINHYANPSAPTAVIQTGCSIKNVKKPDKLRLTAPRPGLKACGHPGGQFCSAGAAQGGEEFLAGASVHSLAKTLLFDANGGAAGVAEHAIHAADGVAAGDQQGL